MKSVGAIYKSTYHGDFKINNYECYKRVTIEFINTGYVMVTQFSKVLTGAVKDKLSPSFLGVGFIGDGIYKARVSGIKTDKYVAWSGMLTRCYSPSALNNLPTYRDCTVCDEWLNFQVFAKWFDDNHIDGYQLDKDLLTQGNKVYSPEFCLFVSSAVNSLLRVSHKQSGDLPAGVYESIGTERYKAICRFNGELFHLGCYSDVHEARQAYVEFKYKAIAIIADKQSEPLKSALLKWDLNL